MLPRPAGARRDKPRGGQRTRVLTQVTAFLVDRAECEVSPSRGDPLRVPATPTAQAGIWTMGALLEIRFAPPTSRAVARGLSYGSKDEIVIPKSAFPSTCMRQISFSLCTFRQIALLSHLQVLRPREESALDTRGSQDCEPLTRNQQAPHRRPPVPPRRNSAMPRRSKS